MLPFGLYNAPATFQSMINRIFGHLYDRKLVAYIDHLLIFSGKEENTAPTYERY